MLRTQAGTRVEAVAQEGHAVGVGSEAYAAVRPEKVRLGDAADNVLQARIDQVVYLGVSIQYIAKVEGGETVVLYQQNIHDETGPTEGDRVSVAWDARHCLVLGG